MYDMDAMTLMEMGVLACAAAVVALVGRAAWPRRWRLIAFLVGALFPAFILSNVVAGVIRSPKSNNLWPIVVGIACAITLPPAYVGAGTGEVIGRLVRRRRLVQGSTKRKRMIFSKFGSKLDLVSKTEGAGGRVSVQGTADGSPDIREFAAADLKADDGLGEISRMIALLPPKVVGGKVERRRQSPC